MIEALRGSGSRKWKAPLVSVDAETDGIDGPVFAIGAVRSNGQRFAGRVAGFEPSDPWTRENVIPALAGWDAVEYPLPRQLVAAFADWLHGMGDDVQLIAHVPHPVETGLMHAVAVMAGQEPRYVMDVAVLLAVEGADPWRLDDWCAAHGHAVVSHNPESDAESALYAYFFALRPTPRQIAKDHNL